MSFASSNRTGLYRVKEATWGVTPVSPALVETRYTGEALDNSISTEKSQEIRADRMVSDLILTDSSPSGSFNFEMSYGSFDDLLESALMSAGWSAAVNVVGIAGDISTVASPTNNLTSTLNTKFAAVNIGDYINVGGFADALNNRLYQVTAKLNGGSITVTPQPNSAETPAGTAATVKSGGRIRNGTLEQSYTLVKQFNDATAVTRHIFRGMRVGGFSLDMQTAAILTGVFNFIGKSAQFSESTFGGETITAASTTEVMNCVTNVQNIFFDGAALGAPGAVMSLQLELDNQHREQKGIGELGNVGVVAGTLMVNVTASQYFESKEQADIFEQSDSFGFSFVLRDNVGNAYVFTLPRCKYESFVANASQLDSDVMADTTFTALRDPLTNCMIQIDRFPVA